MPNVSKIRNLKGQIFYLMAEQVNSHTVQSDVPQNAQFTDTTYDLFTNAASTKKERGGTVPFPSSTQLADDATHRFLNAQGNWIKINEDGEITYKAESTLSYVKDNSEVTNDYSVKLNDVDNNTSSAQYTLTAGQGTTASVNHQVVIGKYNSQDNDSIFLVGNGADAAHKANIFGVSYDGNAFLALDEQDELATAIKALWGANSLAPLVH